MADYVAGTVIVRDKHSEEIRPDWNASSKGQLSTPRLAQPRIVLIKTYLYPRLELDPIVRDNISLPFPGIVENKSFVGFVW